MFKRGEDGAIYFCLFGKRYVFRGGHYIGWYRG